MSMNRLTVILEAQTAQFQRMMKQQSKTVQGLRTVAMRAGTALAGMFAVGAIAGFTRSVLSSSDAIAKQARILQIGHAEMRAYGLAAEHAGMSQAQLSKNMVYFQSRIGEMRRGIMGAERAFQNLNLDREALAGLNVAQSLDVVRERLKGMDNEARTYALRQLFGRSGHQIGEMLKNTEAANKVVRETYEAMGASGDGVKGIEDLNDSLATLKTRLAIIGEVTASEMAPALEFAAESAGKTAIGIGKVFRALGAKYEMDGIIGVGNALLDVQGTLESFDNYRVQLENRQGFALLQAQAKGDADAIAAEEREQAQYLDSLSEMAEKLNAEAVPAGEKFTQTLKDLNAMYNEGMISQEAFQIGIEKANEEYQKSIPEIARAKEMTERYADATETLREEMAELQALADEGLIGEDTLGRGLESLQDALNELDPEFVSMRERFEEMEAAAARVFDATRNPFEKLQSELQDLDELMSEGMIAWDTYARAVNKAWQDSGLMDMPEAAFMEEGPAQRGGAAGVAGAGAIGGLIAQGMVGGAMSREEQALEEQKRSRALLEEIARNTRSQVMAYA